MRCPFCDADKESLKVIDSRACDGGRAIRRRRECGHCAKRFTTYEKIEEPVRVMVVKKDGRRSPWDQGKILRGLERACFKRPVPESELVRIATQVEEEVFRTHDREVRSDLVGKLVTERLRRLDQVAYVRFASVYKQFKTLEELVTEAKAVLDAQRFDDPEQGKLFVEAAPKTVERDPEPPRRAGRPPAKIGNSRMNCHASRCLRYAEDPDVRNLKVSGSSAYLRDRLAWKNGYLKRRV